MSDVYDTYIDENGYERWSSNDKKVLVRQKDGTYKAIRLPKWVRKIVRHVDGDRKRDNK